MSIKDIRKRINGGTQGSQDYRRSSLSTPSSRATPSSGGMPPPVSRGPSAPVKPNVDEEMSDIRKLQAERSRINLENYKKEQEVKNNINRLAAKGETVGAAESKTAQTYTEKGIDAIRKRLIEPVTQALYGEQRTPMPSIGSQIGQVGDKVFAQTLPLGNGNLEKFVTGLTSAGPGMERTFGRDVVARQVASKPGQYGQMVQAIIPGVGAERGAAAALTRFAPTAGRLGAVARGLSGGVVGTAANELQAEGRTAKESLENIGLGGALGAGIPALGVGAKAIVQKGAGAVKKAFEGLTETQLDALRALDRAERTNPAYTKLRVENPNASITEEVARRITPPTEENALISWVKPHVGASWSEMRKLSRPELDDLARQVSEGMDVDQVTREVVAEMGQQPTLRQAGERIGAREAFGEAPNLPENIRRTDTPIGPPRAVETPIQAPESTPVPTTGEAVQESTQPAGTPIERIRQRMQLTNDIVQPPKRGTPKVVKQRSFGKTVAEAPQTGEELKQGIQASENLTYEQVNNAQTMAKAVKAVDKKGPIETVRELKSKKGGWSHDDLARGMRAVQLLEDAGDIEGAVEATEEMAKKLTEAGQLIQAASMMDRLSPSGQLRAFKNAVEREGGTVSKADEDLFYEQAVKKKAGELSKEETVDYFTTLEKMVSTEAITAEDISKIQELISKSSKYVKPEAPKAPKPRTRREKLDATADKWIEEAKAAWKAKQNIGFAQRIDDPDIAILAKLATGYILKGVVKSADVTEALVRDAGEAVRPYAKEIYERAKTAAGVTSKHISQDKLDEAQAALERISKGKTTAEKVTDKFLKENESSLRPGDADKIRDIAKQLNDLKEMDSQQAQIQMQKIMQKYSKASWWDRLQTTRYIGMLLNSVTQAVNAVSGPTMATVGYTADLLGTMLDIGMNKTLGTPRTTTLYGTNPLRFVGHWFKNAKFGGKAGALGANPGGLMGQGDIRGLTFKSLYNPLGLLERGLGAVAKGADYGTYKTVHDSELLKQAWLSAKNSGVKGKDAIKSHMEKYLANPPSDALEQADNIGRATTFQQKNSIGAKAANWVNSAPPVVKQVAQTVFPFVRTPINIASAAVNLTPGGLVKGLYKLFLSETPTEQREALRILGLGLVGTGGLTPLGYYLNKIGVMTGANDTGNKDVNALQEQAGKGKYRFNTSALGRYLSAMIQGQGFEEAEKAAKYQEGDKQFDYNKLQPIAFPLSIGAGMQEHKGEGLANQVSKTAADSFGSFANMSMLKSTQDMFRAATEGTSGQKAAQPIFNIIESFAKSFAPSAVAQEARRRDTTQRITPYGEGIVPDVRGYFQSRTPGQTQNLPPSITTFGETKQYAPGISGAYLNPFKSETAPFNKAAKVVSDLYDRVQNEDLAPAPPDKKVTVKGTDYAIPAKRYAQLQKEQGAEISERILAINQNLSDSEKVDAILKVYEDVRKEQREKLKKELVPGY